MFFNKFERFPAVEKLAVIPWGSIPSFVRTDDILSQFELYKFFNHTDAHGLVYVEYLAALNSHLGGEKSISKNVLSEFFQNLSLQALNELIKKNQRLSFNSVNDFKSEKKTIEEDGVDNIPNNFTNENPQEFISHLFYQNAAGEINKQSQDKEEEKRKLDIVLNERQHETEKRMISVAKKSFENFGRNSWWYFKLSCQFDWP